jgi:hypothetical protein
VQKNGPCHIETQKFELVNLGILELSRISQGEPPKWSTFGEAMSVTMFYTFYYTVLSNFLQGPQGLPGSVCFPVHSLNWTFIIVVEKSTLQGYV